MIGVRIARWAAWSPGLTDEPAWRDWARAPHALGSDGAPALEFLPALQRRRCGPLSRMMLDVAHRCSREAEPVASVFASRHGSFSTLVGLLDTLAREEPLSPAQFSHSVHNTQAGLFSITTGNRRPSTSLAGGADSFAQGFLEAAALLHRERGRPVLFVTGDEPVPEPLRALASGPQGAYALALRLEAGPDLEFELDAPDGAPVPARIERAWPDALEFLRWWIGAERELRIEHPPRRWSWRRTERLPVPPP